MDEMVSRNELYDQYKDLLHYILKPFSKMKSPLYDYNDLFQEGMIGLQSAIDNYKEQKNIKFSLNLLFQIQCQISFQF